MASAKWNVFSRIGETIDSATSAFINEVSSHVIAEITPWAISFTCIYITLYGYMILLGKIQEPFGDFLVKSIKIIFVGTLALNTDNYLLWVVETFHGLESILTIAFQGSKVNSGSSIYATLDFSLDKGAEIISHCWNQAESTSWRHIGTILGWYASGFLIAIGFALVVVSGGIAILVSTFSLKILFAIGPVFIMCSLWPATIRFFESWFGYILNHILIVSITSIVITFAVMVYSHEISKIDLNDKFLNIWLVALELLIISAIFYSLVKMSMSMAAALAGGLTMSVMGIGNLSSYAKGAAGTAKGLGQAGLSTGKGLYGAGKWAAGHMGGSGSNSISKEPPNDYTRPLHEVPAFRRASVAALRKAGIIRNDSGQD